MSAKTSSARLESEAKQERGNLQDLRKMLADERNVMSTMDMEHQQQLVELEQRHQEKVLVCFIPILPISNFENISFYIFVWGVFLHLLLEQVLYLLNQLQSKAESEETKKKDEGSSQDTELLQRLKAQVCFLLSHQS